MKINYKTKKYGLIGNPISKSLSPFIHNTLYQEIGENRIYLSYEIKGNLEDALGALNTLDIEGYNVTLPFKKEIIEYLDELDGEAQKIGAVNTVKIDGGKLIGYNTDGIGFIKSLKDKNIEIGGKNILVVGAGGAAYSICSKLLEEGVGQLYIINRTRSKAEELKKRLDLYFPNKNIYLRDHDSLDRSSIDILVNTSSVGMYPLEDERPIDLEGFKDILIYDLIYKPLKTGLIREGEARGFHCMNGLDMLLNQALASQEIWLGRDLDREDYLKVRKNLEEYLRRG